MRNTYLHILPECYVDTKIVQIIMQVKGVSHQKGTGAVTRKMQTVFKNSFAIGIIDLDKEQSTYAKESIVIAKSDELTLCKHPNSSHYIIKMNNIMENFILHCAEDLQLSLGDYGLPSDLEGMKSITKSKDSINNPQLHTAIKAVTEANEMCLLKEVLEYLNEKRYDCNVDELQQIFHNHGF